MGPIFAIGDPNVLAAHVRQLILNPCAGHARKARNVHNPQLFETIRELVASVAPPASTEQRELAHRESVRSRLRRRARRTVANG